MSLKRIVNEPELWEALKEYVEDERSKQLKTLSVSSEPIDIYRAQGRLYALNNILHLRDRINGKPS